MKGCSSVLMTGEALFLATYLIVTPFINAINQTDVNNLRAMFSGLGIISKILEVPLMLIEKPLKVRAQRAELGEQ